MAEVPSFIQHGWQNIWKQKTIWLFSALPLVNQLFLDNYTRDEQNLLLLLLYLLVNILVIILLIISAIGVPYQAYNFSIGKSASVQETLQAVRKFSGRIIGCFGLVILLLSPVFCSALAIALRDPTRPIPVSNTATLLFLPFSIFGCLWSFAIFGFFEQNWGIRQSVQNAWTLFTAHFGALAILGILMAAIWLMSSVVIGIVVVLLQSGFDTVALSSLNFLDPSITLGKNPLFVVMDGVLQTIYNAFNASVIALAYLKYRA